MAKKKSNTPLIAGAAAGGCLLLCLCGAGIGGLVWMSNDGGGFSGGGGGGGGGDISAEVRTMTTLFEGGSDAWDAAVNPLMVAAYDKNGSGDIDTGSEVSSIPCGTWTAIDDGVKSKWEYGVRTIYGLEADKLWIGGALGLSEIVRAEADAAAAGCLGGAAVAPVAPVVGGGAVASLIGVVPDGGSSTWDEAVKAIMVANYDSNSSGNLDSASEVSAVPCDVWKAMDAGVRGKWTYGIRTIYGFSGGGWIGDAVGFAESQRSAADSKAAGCGLNTD